VRVGRARGCVASRAAGLTGRIASRPLFEAASRIRTESFLIDGQAIVCGLTGGLTSTHCAAGAVLVTWCYSPSTHRRAVSQRAVQDVAEVKEPGESEAVRPEREEGWA